MSKQDPLRIDPLEADARFQRACGLLNEAVETIGDMPGGQRAIGEALAGALETVGGGAPRYEFFGNLREEARWWAETANPVELELYAAASLRRIQNANFAERPRKRIFTTLWWSFTDEERAAFIAAVTKDKPP